MKQKQDLREILKKAEKLQGLSPEEAFFLLDTQDRTLRQEIFDLAKEIKLSIYGRRIVFFAPLYVTNKCVNNCLYCGFRAGNNSIQRKSLKLEEIVKEAELITSQGHKRILLVAGEDLNSFAVEQLVEAIDAIYRACDIRRINVNIAPLSVEDFRTLKQASIGTYQLFQETYHRETYLKMHPKGPKSNFDWRFGAIDRAIEAGIDDVGIGVLFGLYDPRFEVKALIEHCKALEGKWGIGPHTISIPRLRPAGGSLLRETPYQIDDEFFKLIVAVLRLAVPYTGIILSTREDSELRDELLHLGVSQISAGSHTSPGGYESSEVEGQFSVGDLRSLDETLSSVLKAGYLPSFCTACYRKARTGKAFMDMAKGGTIKGKCQPNALLTLKEYLKDYASDEVKILGDALIEQQLTSLPLNEKEEIRVKLKAIQEGKRDLSV